MSINYCMCYQTSKAEGVDLWVLQASVEAGTPGLTLWIYQVTPGDHCHPTSPSQEHHP